MGVKMADTSHEQYLIDKLADNLELAVDFNQTFKYFEELAADYDLTVEELFDSPRASNLYIWKLESYEEWKERKLEEEQEALTANHSTLDA